jgi:hypothetical protein
VIQFENDININRWKDNWFNRWIYKWKFINRTREDQSSKRKDFAKHSSNKKLEINFTIFEITTWLSLIITDSHLDQPCFVRLMKRKTWNILISFVWVLKSICVFFPRKIIINIYQIKEKSSINRRKIVTNVPFGMINYVSNVFGNGDYKMNPVWEERNSTSTKLTLFVKQRSDKLITLTPSKTILEIKVNSRKQWCQIFKISEPAISKTLLEIILTPL